MSIKVKNLPESFRNAAKPPIIPSQFASDAPEAPPLTEKIKDVVLGALPINVKAQAKMIYRGYVTISEKDADSTPSPNFQATSDPEHPFPFDFEL